MGLLDNLGGLEGLGKLAGSLSGMAGGNQQGGAVGGMEQGVAMLLIKGLVEKFGGFQGLLDKFSGSGLQDVVGSWLGDGENAKLAPEQILDTLGHDEIGEVASGLNMEKTQAADLLSKFLPEIADKASTHGVMDLLNNFDHADIPNLLGKFLK